MPSILSCLTLTILLSSCSFHIEMSGKGQKVIPAKQMKITRQPPPTVVAGETILPEIEVSYLDENGLVDKSANRSISVEFKTSPASAILASTLTSTPTDGVTTFNDLNIKKAATGYKLQFKNEDGLIDVSDPFEVVAAAPAKIAVTSSPISMNAEDCWPLPVTYNLLDAYENIAPVSASTTLNLSAAPLEFYSDATCSTTAITSQTLSSGVHSGALYIKSNVAGTHTLTISSGTLVVGSQPVTVYPKAAGKLVITTSSQTRVAGTCSGTVTLETQDLVGNSSPVDTDRTITLTATGFTFYEDASCTTAVSTTTIAQGTTTKSFYFKGTTAGTTTLAATAPGFSPASQAETITPAAASQLAFKVQPSNTVAGVAMSPSVEVSLLDPYGNLATSSTATVDIDIGTNPSGTATLVGGAKSVATVNGVAVFNAANDVKIQKADTGYTLVASATGLTSATSTSFNIVAAAVDHLAFKTPAQTLKAGSCSAVTTVEAQDAFGNTAKVSAATVLSVAGSGISIFSNNTCTTSIPSLNIAAAGSSANFYFKGTIVGNPIVLTSAVTSGTAATSATQNEIITAGNPTQLTFITSPLTTEAGACSDKVEIKVTDTWGNDVPVGVDSSVTLAANDSATTFFSSATCTPGDEITTTTLTSATSKASFYYKSTKAGTDKISVLSTVTALDNLPYVVSGSQDHIITASTAHHLAFLVQPTNTPAGTAIAPAVKIVVQDQFANTVTSYATAITIDIKNNPGAGSIVGGPQSQTPTLGIATFTGATALVIQQIGTGYTLKADSGTLVEAESSAFNILVGPPARYRVLAAATDVTAGFCSSAPVTIQVEDSFGNISPVSASTAITYASTPSGAGGLQFFSNASCTTAAAATLASGSSALSFYYKAKTSGTNSMVVTLPGITCTAATGCTVANNTQSINVTADVPYQLAWVTSPIVSPNEVEAGACSPIITISSVDQFGNLSPVTGSDQALTLTPSSGSFYSDNTCTTAIDNTTSPLKITIGNSKADLYFLTTVSAGGQFIATAQSSFSGTFAGGLASPHSSTVTQTHSMKAAPPDHFQIITQPSNSIAGQAIIGPFTGELRDRFENPASTSTAKAYVNIETFSTATLPTLFGAGLTSSNTPTNPVGKNYFPATPVQSLWTNAVGGQLIYSGAKAINIQKVGTYTLRLSALGIEFKPSAESVSFNVTNAAASKLAFLSAAQTLVAGTCSGAVTIQSQDTYSNSAVLSTTTTVAPSGTGYTFYSDSSCTTPITTVDIASGTNSATFYFKGTVASAAQALTVTRTAGTALTAASQNQVITPDIPHHLGYTTPIRTVAAGACSSVITLQSQDQYNNASPVTGASVQSLTTVGNPVAADLTFYSDSSCTTSIGTSATILSGASSVNFYAKGTLVGTVAVTGTPDFRPAGTATQTETIIAGALNKIVYLAGDNQTLTAGDCSAVSTIELRDLYDNPVSGAPTTVLFSTSDPGYTFYSDASCSTSIPSLAIGTGTTQGSFYFKSTISGIPRNVKTNVGAVTKTAAHNINPAGFTKFAFTNGTSTITALTVTAGVCQALTVQAQDAFGNPVSSNLSNQRAVLQASTADTVYYSTAGCAGGTELPLTGGADTFPNQPYVVINNDIQSTVYIRNIKKGTYTLGAVDDAITFAGTFALTVNADVPTHLGFVPNIQTSVAGNPLEAVPLTVAVLDQFNNIATSTASITIAMDETNVSNGTATLGGTLTATAVAGSATFATANITKAGTNYTLKANATGLTKGISNTFDVVASAPTKVAITSPAHSVTAGQCSPASTVTITDDYGNPAVVTVDTAIDLAGNGLTFYTDASCTTSAGNQVTVPNGSSSTNFYYVPTQSGTVSLDAERTTAPVLAGDHQNQTVAPGTAESIAFSTPARTDIVAGVCSGAGKIITIELKDHFGNRTTNSSGSSYNVNFASIASTTAKLYADATCSTELGKSGADYQVSIANGGSFFDVYVLDDKAESVPLVVTIAENGWTANQTEIVIPATPTKLVYISSPITGLVAGTCSNAVSFQSQDAKGNASPVTSNTTVTLGSDASMNYYSDSNCTAPLSNVVLANGTSAGTFYFKTTLAGSHDVLLTATGLTSDTQTETVVHDVVNKLGFKVQPTNTVAGQPIAPAVQVEARDQYGNLVSSYSGTIDIVKDATPSGTLNGTTSVATTAGTSSFTDLSINQSGVGYRLTASSGGLINAQSSAFNILSAAPDSLYFATLPQSLDVKNCSAATTVGVNDQFLNPTTVSSNTTVQLTGTDITFYSDSSCTNVITDTTILSGQGTSQFWFKATKAGQKDITTSVAGLTPATQTETIAPGVVSQLAVISTPQTVRSGECSSPIDIESQDADGNTAPATGLISISAIGPNYTFYTDAACTVPATLISIAPGSSSTQLYFRGAALGTSSITLTAMGLSPSPTQTETIVPGFGSKLKFTTAGQNLLTNQCSTLTEFKVLDTNGNDTTVENPVVIDLTPTLGLTFYSDSGCTTSITTTTINPNTPLAGKSEGGFYFLTGNQAGTATTTVEVYSTTSPDADRFKYTGAEDILSHTVTARAPTKLSMLGNGQTLRVSSCSAAITVQTQDTFNNTSPVTADTTIALSSSHTIQYFRDVNCLIPISPANMTLPAGNSSVSFYIKSMIADTITVTASATVEGNASSDGDNFIITPAAGATLFYTSVPSDTHPVIKAGNCIGVYNVELRDRFGNKTQADMDYPLVLSSTYSKYYNDASCTDEIVPLYPSTDRVVTILTGQSTLGPIYMRTETPGYESTTLSSYSGLENAFDQFMVYPNNPSRLVITTPATSTEAGVCSNAIIVKSTDDFNNDSSPSSDLTVNLNWDMDSQWIANDGKIAFYSDSACTTVVNSITIPTTDFKAEFYIKGTVARGDYVTTASSGVLNSAQQSQTIIPSLDNGFRLMSYPTSVQTGLCSPMFFGYQADAYNNFIFKSSKISPSSNDPAVTFYSDSSCSTQALNVFAGKQFYMIAPNPGNIQLNFWSGQYVPVTHYNVNVGTTTLDKISVTTSPHRVGLSYCSPGVTAQFQDHSGAPKNVTAVGGLDLNLNGLMTKFYTTPDCSGASVSKVNIPKDSDSATFYYKVFYDPNFFTERSTTNSFTITTSDPDIVAATQSYEVQHLFNAAGNSHWNEVTATLPTQILREACTPVSLQYIGNMHAYPIDVTITPSANVDIYSDSGCTSPLTTAHRDPSQTTGYIVYYMKAHASGTVSVTYSEPYLNSKTETTWVNDTYLSLNQVLLPTGTCTAFDLQSKDYTGAPSAVTGTPLDITFKFTKDFEGWTFTGIGAFSDAACTNAIGGITLNPGDTTARFYMFDSKAPEKGTLSGSVTDITRTLPLKEVITVNAGAISKFILWPNMDSIAMGECSYALYLYSADSQGNRVPAPSAMTVSLSAQTLNASGLPSGTLQPGVKYYSDQNCTNQITSKVIPISSYSSSAFYMKTNFSAPFAAFATSGAVSSYYLMSSATERLAIVDSPNVPSKEAYVCRPFTVQYQDVNSGQAKNPALPVPIVVSVPAGFNTPSDLAYLYPTSNCTGLNVDSFEDVINPVPGSPTQGDIEVGVTKTYSILMKSLAPVDITVTSPGRVSGKSTVETVPPPGSKLLFPTYATVIEAGVCSGAQKYIANNGGSSFTYFGAISAALVTSDATGNKPLFGGAQTLIDLQSPTLKFYSDKDCNTEITSIDVPGNKQTSPGFFFKSTVAGPNELVGFGQITGDAAGLSGNVIKRVKPSTVYQIGFGSDPQTIRAGDCSEDLVLEVQDRYGNEQVDTVKNEVSFSYPTGFTLYSDSACTNSIATTFIAANQSRKPIWFRHTTAGDVDVTPVPVRQLEGITQTEKILSGAASFLRFTNAPITVPKGTCSSAATLQIQDFGGNSVPAASDAIVSLLGDSAFGLIFYSDSDCNLASAINTVTIPTGQSSASFYFVAHTEGQALITAKSTGLVDAKQKETIAAGIPVKLSFANSSITIGAGSCSKPLTVEVQDAYGDSSAALANTTLSLSGPNATFYSDQYCTSPIVSLALNSGQSTKTFYVQSTVAGNLDVTVTDNALGTLTQAVQMETVVPGAMSATTFLTSASTLPVGKCSSATKVGVKDRYGNPTTPPDRYTLLLNLSGPSIQFYSDSQCNVVLSGNQIAQKSGDPFASFYYLSNSIGSRTISVANGANLDTTSQIETFTASSPTKLGFITPSRNVSSGQCSQIITFATMDPMSNETNADQNYSVTLTPPAGAQFYSTSNCAGGSEISTATILSGTSRADVYLKVPAVAGNYSLSISEGSLTGANQNVTVGGGTPAKLSFTSTAQTGVVIQTCSALTTFGFKDASDNTTVAAGNTAVTLSSAEATFYSDAACSNSITTVNVGTGQSSGSFYFKPSQVGTVTIQVSSGGLTSDTQNETAVAGAATKLVFTSAPQTFIAGTCKTATLQTQDNLSNPAISASIRTITLAYSGSAATFYTSGDCSGGSTTTLSLPANNSSITFSYKITASGTSNFTGSSSGLAQATQTQTINPDVPVTLAFSTSARTVTAGVCSQNVVIQSRDTFGNPSPLGADKTIALAAAPLHFYTDSGCSNEITTIDIVNGTHSSTFYFKSTTSGSLPLGISTTGLTSANQTETVNPDVPTKLAYLNAPLNITAGTCSALSMQVQDQYNNPSPVGSSTTITYQMSGTTAGIYSDSGCTNGISSQVLASGHTFTAYFKSTLTGSTTVRISAPSIAFVDQTETINPGAATHIAYTTAPFTLNAGQCSGDIGPATVQVQDALNNPVPVGSATAFNLSGTGYTFYSDNTCTTTVTSLPVSIGSHTASFYFKSTTAGVSAITTAMTGFTSINQNQTINSLGLSRVGFSISSPTFATTVCTAVTVQTQDTYGNPVVRAQNTNVNLSVTSGTLSIYSNSGCTTSTSSAVVPSGSASAPTIYVKSNVSGSPILTATDAGAVLNSSNLNLTVTAGTPTKIAFATGAQSITANTCSSAITIQAQDVNSNPATLTATRTVNLTVSPVVASGLLFYSDSGCSSQITSINMNSGVQSVNVYAKSLKTNTYTLSAATTGWTTVTQNITVNAGAVSAVAVTAGAAQPSLKAGLCSAAVTIETRDAQANPTKPASNMNFNLTGTNLTFYSDSGCTAQITQTTVLNSATTSTFYYKGTVLGSYTINISGTVSTTATTTIVPGTPTTLKIVAPITAIHTDTCSTAFTVRTMDNYSNYSSVSSSQVVALSVSPSLGQLYSDFGCVTPLSPEQITVTSGTSTSANFYFKNSTVEPVVTLTAQLAGYTTDSKNVAVNSTGPRIELYEYTSNTHIASGGSFDYGVATVDTPQSFYIKNDGTTVTGSLSVQLVADTVNPTPVGSATMWTLQTDMCSGQTLAVGATCLITVKFNAQTGSKPAGDYYYGNIRVQSTPKADGDGSVDVQVLGIKQ